MQPIAFVFSIHDGWTNEPIVSDLLDIVANFTKRVAQLFTDDYMFWANAFRQLIYIIFLLGIVPMVVITMSFAYFTEREKTEAIGLRIHFEKFGKRSRTRETKADFE